MADEYWIPISLISEYTQDRIKEAIKACHTVDTWTTNKLRERFVETLTVPTNLEIRLNLSKFIKEEKLLRQAQRYSLDCAAFAVAERFREQLRVTVEDQITFSQPIPEEEFTSIKIQSRKIWKRYLEKYGQLSTAYGNLLLEDDWKEILWLQAYDNKVSMAKLPNLWKSITLKDFGEKYGIKFNLLES